MTRPDPAWWRDRTVAVTGGVGFLGRAVVRDLDSLGAKIRVIRSDEYDLREPRATREAVSGSQVVLHLAARVGGIGFNRRNPGPSSTTTL